MQRHLTEPMPASALPTTEDILGIWRADRCLRDSSAGVYLRWIRRFREYCVQHQLDERNELTLSGLHRFIAWYERRSHVASWHQSGAISAVQALRRVYRVMEMTLPPWQAPPPPSQPPSVLLKTYADYLVQVRGLPAITVQLQLGHVGKLLDYLACHEKSLSSITLLDIDEFLIQVAQRYARSTTAGIASSLRAFMRFLFASQRIPNELADSVIAPLRPRFERPLRALLWNDVQRLLQAVDTSSPRGLRDHALLLMMSIYGLGAGEVTRLQLQDIDWSTGVFTVTRPKTGVVFALPLLPAVAEVLARYLRHSRPMHTPTRHVFVQGKTPYNPLSSSSAVRHILIKHARAAGLDAPYLGSHVLRHSNAARHLAVGTRPRVLSGLLGHRDPESVSAYARIATESLRDISLPVPK